MIGIKIFSYFDSAPIITPKIGFYMNIIPCFTQYLLYHVPSSL